MSKQDAQRGIKRAVSASRGHADPGGAGAEPDFICGEASADPARRCAPAAIPHIRETAGEGDEAPYDPAVVRTRYAGPTDPFPFLDHRTVAETWQPKRASSRRLGYDPEPESIRPKAQAADRRFARAMKKTGASFA